MNKLKENLSYSGFYLPVNHNVKIKESEKRDKYLDQARELRLLRNMRITVIPILIGALGTASKGVKREPQEVKIGGRIETI